MVIPAPSVVLPLIQANFLGQSLISKNHLETRSVLSSAPRRGDGGVELIIQTVDFLLPQQEHSQPRTSPQSRGSCGSAIGDDCDSAEISSGFVLQSRAHDIRFRCFARI